MSRCLICTIPITDRETPWSLCYDPAYKRNVWGGDTHEVRGVICPTCATHLLLVAQSHKSAIDANYTRGLEDGCGGGGKRP